MDVSAFSADEKAFVEQLYAGDGFGFAVRRDRVITREAEVETAALVYRGMTSPAGEG